MDKWHLCLLKITRSSDTVNTICQHDPLLFYYPAPLSLQVQTVQGYNNSLGTDHKPENWPPASRLPLSTTVYACDTLHSGARIWSKVRRQLKVEIITV